MTEGVETIRSAVRQDIVTIGATAAFSILWLLPRIASFRQRHPGTQIRVVSGDSRVNLESGEFDIALRYGSSDFADGIAVASCGDRIVPVCAPDYARRHTGDQLWNGSHDLIETEVHDRSWYRWRDWFARVGQKGFKGEPSLRFSHYNETISAARAGQGVALGWCALLKDMLAD